MTRQFPDEFVRSLAQVPQCDAPRLLQALQQEPQVSVRVNRLKVPHAPGLEPVPWCAGAGYLATRPIFTLDPLLHAGAYYVQEASSMLVGHVVTQLFGQCENLRVLDACAAPGGKSTLLASVLHESSLLVANECVRQRSAYLSENLQKWGAPNMVVTNAEPRLFAAFPAYFDLVVADVPCSGEGMFRKDEVAVQEWSPENVAMCAERQRQIVADLWPSLRPGGMLLYSTCTFNTAENEENAAWIRDTLGAESVPVAVDASWGVAEVDTAGIKSYRCFPDRCRGEGFSFAVLRKLDHDDDPGKVSVRMKSRSFFHLMAEKELGGLRAWAKPRDYAFIQLSNGEISVVAHEFVSELMFIGDNVKVVLAGNRVGLLKGKDLIPDPAFAFSLALNPGAFDRVETDKRTALKYLAKESLVLPGASVGWKLLTYKNVPYGFVKNIGNRANNSYPQEWRIRMDVGNGDGWELPARGDDVKIGTINKIV